MRRALLRFLCGLVVLSLAAAQPDENQVYVITSPEHSPEEMKAALGELPPSRYVPPTERWRRLPRTAAALARGGGELRVVMLGDSIVNDTARSRWGDAVQALYPATRISVVAVVRGSTGCWWYKEENRIELYVAPHHPDLVIIGGISHHEDIASIRDVVGRIHRSGPCDVLLMTGAFGETDPNDPNQWSYDIPATRGGYRAQLRALADEERDAFLDMTAEWGRVLRDSGRPLEWFKRDAIHANIRGEQVLGRVLATYFAPDRTP